MQQRRRLTVMLPTPEHEDDGREVSEAGEVGEGGAG